MCRIGGVAAVPDKVNRYGLGLERQWCLIQFPQWSKCHIVKLGCDKVAPFYKSSNTALLMQRGI